MVIAVHLALFQVIVLSAFCTRFTFAKQKQNVFDRNSVGRLSVGFGKRTSNLQASEVKNSGKTTRESEESTDADDTVLFNHILDRLSYGYGKRATDIYKSLQAKGVYELPKRSTPGPYTTDDILRQRLIDVLVNNIKQTPDFSTIDNYAWNNEQDELSNDYYDGYEDPIR